MNRRTLTVCAVGLVFAAVALSRLDLVAGAARQTIDSLQRGGPLRWKILGEMALFAAILLASWSVISKRALSKRDAAVFGLGLLAGWAAEAWGTRLGLWRYYTGEAPPLWIVPAWPVGAVMIDRLSEDAAAGRGRLPGAWYWFFAVASIAYCLWFSAPWLDRPAGWIGPAAALALLWRAPEDADGWALPIGFACVFFADLWGTTNHCWRYYLHAEALGLWKGILFGMFFDTAVVLVCLRAARFNRLLS